MWKPITVRLMLVFKETGHYVVETIDVWARSTEDAYVQAAAIFVRRGYEIDGLEVIA